MWWLIGVAVSAFLCIIGLTIVYQMYSDDYDFLSGFPLLCLAAVVLTVFWPVAYPAAVFLTVSVLLGKWIARKWFKKESK